jgi:hypothetical protein
VAGGARGGGFLYSCADGEAFERKRGAAPVPPFRGRARSLPCSSGWAVLEGSPSGCLGHTEGSVGGKRGSARGGHPRVRGGEETAIRSEGRFLPLGSVRQKAGKLVHAWAWEGEADPRRARSNVMRTEWPPTRGGGSHFRRTTGASGSAHATPDKRSIRRQPNCSIGWRPRSPATCRANPTSPQGRMPSVFSGVARSRRRWKAAYNHLQVDPRKPGQRQGWGRLLSLWYTTGVYVLRHVKRIVEVNFHWLSKR